MRVAITRKFRHPELLPIAIHESDLREIERQSDLLLAQAKVQFGLTVALRLTGLTKLLYEVIRLRTMNSLWPVYSKGLPLEPTTERSVVNSYHLLYVISYGQNRTRLAVRRPH